MRELLIVLADFYVPDGGESAFVHDGSGLVGLARAIRFGSTALVQEGWRAWLSRWLGSETLAASQPATVASAAAQRSAGEPFVWIAQPVHLITGLRSVHLDHAGLLQVDATTQSQLVESFTKDFAHSPFKLAALPSGSFLMSGSPAPDVKTYDPARYLGSAINGATPTGAGAASLQRLVAEMEMWLHEHPINRARAKVRQRSISTLWLWGGGVPLTQSTMQPTQGEVKQALFGDDPYLDGLIALDIAKRAKAVDLASLIDMNVDRAAAVVEAYRLPENNSISTPLQAIEDIDRRWLTPAVEALRQKRIERLHIIANDRCVTISSQDRLKFWRRSRSPLAALQ